MSYQAKKPRKKSMRVRTGLKVRTVKCWYVTVEDETGTEVDHDWCFGTREDAMRDGERMLKAMQEADVE